MKCPILNFRVNPNPNQDPLAGGQAAAAAPGRSAGASKFQIEAFILCCGNAHLVEEKCSTVPVVPFSTLRQSGEGLPESRCCVEER